MLFFLFDEENAKKFMIKLLFESYLKIYHNSTKGQKVTAFLTFGCF